MNNSQLSVLKLFSICVLGAAAMLANACGPITYAKPPASPKVQIRTETGENLDAKTATEEATKDVVTKGAAPTPDTKGKVSGQASAVDYADQKLQRSGKRQFRRQGCALCHKTSGVEMAVGPNLEGVGAKLTVDDLRVWILDPKAKKPDTTMPKFKGTEAELDAILAFLNSLQ